MKNSSASQSVFVRTIAGFTVFALFALTAFAEAPKYAEGKVLIKPKANVAAEKLEEKHKAFGASVNHVFKRFGNIQSVKLPKGKSVKDAIAFYQKSGLVEFAEPDYIVSIVTTLPDDTRFSELWGMNNTGQTGGTADADIDATEAWDIRTDASSIIVAVIDTGVRYTHEDLAGNMWKNPGETGLDGNNNNKETNGIDDDGNGIIDDVYGMRSLNGVKNGDPMDDHNHGSHVAGSIGGYGNNTKGVAGVCWRVKIMALKFLNSGGSGSIDDAVQCVNYAIDKGAKIMSNSWGGGGYSQAMFDAISAAKAQGIIFVAAAGNNGSNNDTSAFYPARYDVDNVVAVAATDHNDLLASFSNYGVNTVHLGAPGVSVLSCWKADDASYGVYDGTSMATPHVSGAMALVWAQFPALSYGEVIGRVLGTTDQIASLTGRTITGGRLNVNNALTQAPRPIARLTASPTSGEPPLTVTFSDSSTGDITSRSLDFGDGTPPTSNTNTTHAYTATGTYNAVLTVNGPNNSSTAVARIVVAHNYTMSADTYSWIDPSSHTALPLTDDSVSDALALPFTFKFYEQNYNSVYVGSNGLAGFDPDGLYSFFNEDMPSGATPNNIIAAYWDDLNPDMAGAVRFGVTGTAPNRRAVISWVGVPHYFDDTAAFTFQIVLFEGSNDIKLQYRQVQPTNIFYGAGVSATVGVEDAAGGIAKKYTYEGVPSLLSNNQAIRFTMATPPPPPLPAKIAVTPASHDYGNVIVGSSANFVFTVRNDGSETLNGNASAPAPYSIVGSSAYSIAGGGSAAVTVRFAPSSGGTFPSTVTFTGGGGTTAGVTGVGLNAPTVTISSPANDASFSNTTAITFTGTAGDVEDGDLTASISWSSNLSGHIGDGGSVTAVLAVGTHTITASVTDSDGLTTTRSITITVTAPAPPAAPSGLTGSVSARTVTLNWVDNSNNETGFAIQRGVKAGKVWVFTTVAARPANTRTYSETLTAAGNYRYRVRAYNGNGDSAFSNTVQVRVK